MSQPKKKKNWLYNGIILLIFLLGFGILLYPMISAVYYDYEAKNDVDTYNEEVELLAEKEINERIELAKAYNETLTPNESLSDFYTEKDKERGKQMYAKMLEVNEMIGTVEIPAIHQKLPVFAGTEEKILQKGIGHLEKTSLPVGGKNTKSVLTGHRGLPDKKLFTDLPNVKKEDMIYYKNIKETLAYKVVRIEEVLPSQTEVLNIEEDKDLMVLITCTPYMINSHRLIVTAERVPYTEEVEKAHEEEQVSEWLKFLKVYKYYLIGIIVFLSLLYLLSRRKKQKNED